MPAAVASSAEAAPIGAVPQQRQVAAVAAAAGGPWPIAHLQGGLWGLNAAAAAAGPQQTPGWPAGQHASTDDSNYGMRIGMSMSYGATDLHMALR